MVIPWITIIAIIAILTFVIDYFVIENKLVSLIAAIVIYIIAANVDLHDEQDISLKSQDLKGITHEKVSDVSRFVIK